MSIVERLGGFWCCKDKTFIWIVQGFYAKSAEMEVILNRCVIMDKREDRLRSGSWLLRSLIVWKAERCYLWSIDVGRADPEKPNGKESKGRKGFWNYE